MRDLQIYKVDVDMSSGILFAKQKPSLAELLILIIKTSLPTSEADHKSSH